MLTPETRKLRLSPRSPHVVAQQAFLDIAANSLLLQNCAPSEKCPKGLSRRVSRRCQAIAAVVQNTVDSPSLFSMMRVFWSSIKDAPPRRIYSIVRQPTALWREMTTTKPPPPTVLASLILRLSIGRSSFMPDFANFEGKRRFWSTTHCLSTRRRSYPGWKLPARFLANYCKLRTESRKLSFAIFNGFVFWRFLHQVFIIFLPGSGRSDGDGLI